MNNADYWRGRFSILSDSAHRKANRSISDLEQMFVEAEHSVQAEIEKWYGRFAVNNQISMAEARKMLTTGQLEEFKWTVEKYIQVGQTANLSPEWLRKLENASTRFHVSRLEAIQTQIQQQIEVLYGGQTDSIDKLLRDIAGNGYTRTAFEIQKGIGLGWDITALNPKRLDTLLSTPWTADNRTFRDRCWTGKAQLVQNVQKALTQGMLRGDGSQKITDAVKKQFNVSRYQAGRLVHTETTYFNAIASKECYRDLGVDDVEVIETLDSHTCDICQPLDGAIVPMAEYEPGVTVPPFHPNCRGTTAPAINPNILGERAARKADDQPTYYVPSNMKYADWEKTFVQGGTKDGLQAVSDGAIIQKTFADKIKDVREAIAQNGGTVEESHIMDAGKAVAEEYTAKTQAMLHEYETAKAEYEAFGDRIDELNNQINALLTGKAGSADEFNPYEALVESGNLYEKHKAEIERLSAMKTAILDSKEFIDAENRMNQAADAINKFHFDNSAKWLKETLAQVRDMGSDGLDVAGHLMKSGSVVRPVVEKAYSYYPKDWVEKSIARGTLTPKKVSRGYYSDYNQVIAISGTGSRGFETAVHELGHRMERAVPGVLDAEKAFYARRTQGEQLEWLGAITGNSAYRRDEKARKDKFISPYMGKDYGGTAFELVSMGFEYAYTQPAYLAADPDMQAWVYGLLTLL